MCSGLTSMAWATSSGAASTLKFGATLTVLAASSDASSRAMFLATSASVDGALPSCTKARASPNCRFRSISSTDFVSARCEARFVARKVAPAPPLHGRKARILPASRGLAPTSFAAMRLTAASSAGAVAGDGSTSRTPARMELIRNSGVCVEHSRMTAREG